MLQTFITFGAILSSLKAKRTNQLKSIASALELEPKLVAAQFGWATTLQKQGKQNEAAEKYNKAAEFDPQSAPQIYFEWGNLLRSQGKLDDAIERYRKMAELDPRSFVAYKFWGDTLKQQGKHEQAEQIMSKAAEVDPTIHRNR